MNLGEMYPAVLTIVLIGVLLGVGIVILGTLMTNDAIAAVPEAATAINTTLKGLGTFATWIGIIVLVIAAAIVLTLVIKSFSNRSG